MTRKLMLAAAVLLTVVAVPQLAAARGGGHGGGHGGGGHGGGGFRGGFGGGYGFYPGYYGAYDGGCWRWVRRPVWHRVNVCY